MPDILPDQSDRTESRPRDDAPAHDGIIETWFRDHFAGTILGGTTELFNAAHAAKEDLKTRLR